MTEKSLEGLTIVNLSDRDCFNTGTFSSDAATEGSFEPFESCAFEVALTLISVSFSLILRSSNLLDRLGGVSENYWISRGYLKLP